MKKIVKLGLITIVATISVTPVLYKVVNNGYNYYDQTTNPEDVEFSTDPNHFNLVEIFTDGLDGTQFTQKALKEDSLKDMTLYDNFYNLTTSTAYSVPILWGGKKYNPFQVSKDLNIPISWVGEETYKHNWYNSFLYHESLNRSYFAERTVINPIDLCYVPNYDWNASWVGDAVKLKKDGFNVASWKDVMKSSINDEFPDSAAYSWLNQHSRLAPDMQKGARVQLNDLITHGPRIINAYKQNNSMDESYDEVIKKYKQVVQTLKAIKDKNGRTAYDNTMIMFYGDHCDHGLAMSKPYVDASNSVLMVKYPDIHRGSIEVNNDRVIPSVYLNNIIDDFVKNNNENYIKTSSSFDRNIEFPIYEVIGKPRLIRAHANSENMAEEVSSINIDSSQVGLYINEIEKFGGYDA